MAKILIADDDPQVLNVLGTILKGAGHETIAATDGEQAFQLFQQQRPAVAILDVMMPRIAGQGLCVKIKREAPNTGVVLISGVMTDPVFIKEAPAKFKNDAYLLKPFTPEQLLAAVKPLAERAPVSTGVAPAEAELILGSEPKPNPAGARSPASSATGGGTPTERGPGPWAGAASSSADDRAKAAANAAAVAAALARNKAPTGAAPAVASQSLGPQPSFSVDGNLEKFSVIALLYRCWNEKLFGKLIFKKDVAAKEIWVRDGKLVYASSNLDTDKLEHRLLSQGKLSAEKAQDVRVLAKGLGGTEAALVQLKLVPPAEVFEAARDVGLSLTLEVFKWLGGRYQFLQGVAPPTNLSLDLPLEDLIHRGLKESFDLDRLQRGLGGRLKAPAEKDLVRLAAVESLKLSPAEFRLSRMIDGKKTVEGIAKEWSGGDVPKEIRALQILYLMSEAGMIRFAETQETKQNQAQLEGLKTKLAQLEKGTLFDALGLKKESSVADVKKAYFAMAKQYHPDTLPTDATTENRKLIEGIFAILSRANQVLQDPKQRDEYVKELEGGGAAAEAEAERILTAELEFQKAEILLLKKRDVAGAEPVLQNALKINPNEAEHHILWGWLIWLKTKKAPDAMKHIEAGLKMRANVPRAWLFIGHIQKSLGDIEKAEKAYRKCLSMDDKNGDALSELRLIAMRKGKK